MTETWIVSADFSVCAHGAPTWPRPWPSDDTPCTACTALLGPGRRQFGMCPSCRGTVCPRCRQCGCYPAGCKGLAGCKCGDLLWEAHRQEQPHGLITGARHGCGWCQYVRAVKDAADAARITRRDKRRLARAATRAKGLAS